MHLRTSKTLQELDKTDWFTNVGKPDTNAAILLSSWEEAIKSCSSQEWEDLNLEAANRYRERLVERSPERFSKWNEIVRDVKMSSMPLVERKIAGVMHQHKLPKVFADCVQWDILHTCMEAEYADVFPPGYYASQSFWYAHGHFPCGWQGVFPAGKLIIY